MYKTHKKNAFGIMRGHHQDVLADIAKGRIQKRSKFHDNGKRIHLSEKILNSNANYKKNTAQQENSSWVSASVGSLLDTRSQSISRYIMLSGDWENHSLLHFQKQSGAGLSLISNPLKNDPERFYAGKKCVHIQASNLVLSPGHRINLPVKIKTLPAHYQYHQLNAVFAILQ